MKHSYWISDPRARFNENALYAFRKTFTLDATVPAEMEISAEARYKLYVNGKFFSHGPCKAPRGKMYYDAVDVSGALREGENELLVYVAQLNSEDDVTAHRMANSVYRSGQLLLAAELTLRAPDGERVIPTDDSWEVAPVPGVTFIQPPLGVFSALNEEVDSAGYAPVGFIPAVKRDVVRTDDVHSFCFGEISRYYLSRRPIPNFYRKKVKPVKILDGTYDLGELEFGYMHVRAHGAGSVKITYAEAFGNFGDKKDRTDSSKELIGDFDLLHVEGEINFTSFYFRTARFVRLECEGDVTVDAVGFTETGYPIFPREDYDFGTPEDNALWEISVRTLRRCMHETYEDCPYYEQMQYQMDTSLQMLFNYQLTDDDALARKAMDDFASSQRADGLMEARYPSCKIQYIPTFSFFFIFMVSEHYKRFGDAELVREHIDACDGVLKWFRHHMNDQSLVNRTYFWNFIDWSDSWAAGVPNGDDNCPLAIHSFMFAYFLQLGAKLNCVIGRDSTASEYEELAEELIAAANETYFDRERQMYADDPAHKYFSQHAQVWAVLCGACDTETGKVALIKSFSCTPKSTFAFAYFLFRALEKCDLYEKTSFIYDKLYSLLPLHCSTVPETPDNARSECHAWGSIAIYEFSSHILGVRYDVDAKELFIDPDYSGRDHAYGTVSTPFGDVRVEWHNSDGLCSISVTTDSDCEKEITLPNGRTLATTEECFHWTKKA